MNIHYEDIPIKCHTLLNTNKKMSSITVTDVFNSFEKFGCIFDYDLKKVRDLKTLNPKSQYDTTYIPIVFLHINGKRLPVKLKFSELLISSSAKLPHSSSTIEEMEAKQAYPKNVNICISQLEREVIECGDYVPKKKNTPEEQAKEDARVSENIDRYTKILSDFLKALDIINNSYITLCGKLKQNQKTFPFRLNKDRKVKDIHINSIKQTSRIDESTNEETPLDTPIFRLKVPVCSKDGRIGIWSNYYKKFKPTVFDARKMTKKNNYQPVPAKVKTPNKELVDLHISNVQNFITMKSLIGGHIRFECIISSKFGLSLNNSFYDLYVYRHKSKVSEPSITPEVIARMRGCDTEEEESDSDYEVDEPIETNADEEDDDDDEGLDGEPEDTDEE